jgi:5'(3')-deoxyribonucleotidase
VTVGIDLDGVLADQIADVLPRIRRRLGIDLSYDAITEFRLRLGPTDLAHEIKRAQTDPSYLLNMPVHEGAGGLLDELARHHRIIIITARPTASRHLTERWLSAHGFRCDALINAEEAKKSIYGADVLIDDYTENIRDFTAQSNGLGILVDRPWNRRDRAALHGAFSEERAKVAETLARVPKLVDEFAQARASTPA